MATKFSSYIFYCQTAVHAGDGTSTGTIDMPIQREKTTGFPVLRDSTTRGSIRESFETSLLASIEKKKKEDNKEQNEQVNWENGEKENLEKFHATFGHRKNGDKASALSVLPARLLFFPVRSFKGVFAYVTCPFILKRFAEEMKLFHNKCVEIGNNLLNLDENNAIASGSLFIKDDKIGLEEYIFNATKVENGNLSPILNLFKNDEIERLKDHIAIINDTQFAYFTRLFTEKVTRNKIKIETGVADDKGLFNEEFLPEESILYTTFGFANEFKENGGLSDDKIQQYFDENFTSIFQLGGDKSVGKGLISPYKINFDESKNNCDEKSETE